MAEKNIGKITQIISAVLDIKFAGKLPEIYEAIEIPLADGGKFVPWGNFRISTNRSH